MPERLRLIGKHTNVYHALTMVWPLVCRRLEGFPNITSTQLFEELCVQFPGRFHPKHVDRLALNRSLMEIFPRLRPQHADVKVPALLGTPARLYITLPFANSHEHPPPGVLDCVAIHPEPQCR
jgi:hypothetical protein